MVYLVLGSAGSGRREVLSDLIAGGLGEDAVPAVLLPKGEAPDDADARLPRLGRWEMSSPESAEAEVPDGATHVFIVLDGRLDPANQLEALKAWLPTRNGELARILCVVNCKLLESHPKLFPWFEACVHFSDVVLLARREGVSNKWISDFQGRFEQQFYPCLFEFVRDGKVKNPALILSPEARRLSHAFDEDEWVSEDEDEEGDEQEDGEEVEVTAKLDRYFERRNGGRRVIELPHIADFLGKPGS